MADKADGASAPDDKDPFNLRVGDGDVAGVDDLDGAFEPFRCAPPAIACGVTIDASPRPMEGVEQERAALLETCAGLGGLTRFSVLGTLTTA
jgi:hypothetical protein